MCGFYKLSIDVTSLLHSGWLGTSSYYRLLGVLNPVNRVVYGQLIGLAFGYRSWFFQGNTSGSTCCPSFQASVSLPKLHRHGNLIVGLVATNSGRTSGRCPAKRQIGECRGLSHRFRCLCCYTQQHHQNKRQRQHSRFHHAPPLLS